ncbi:PH domain-containing protein [Candidatus Microgenomates bacterium]|nr:PH domain-containing protein [Candidatus Microgenomates bacterium]
MSKDKDYSGYGFAGQHEGEKVHTVFRQHPIVMRKSLIAFLLVLVVFALPLSIWPLEAWPWWSLLIGFVLGLLIIGYRMIGWYFSVFIVTDERLIQISQKGFFDRKVGDIGLNKIQSVNYEVKGMQATMFRFGTINVQTYVGDLDLRYIHHPEVVHQLIVKEMRNFQPAGPAGSDMVPSKAESGV